MLSKSAIVGSVALIICSITSSTLIHAGESQVLADVHTWQWRHGREDCGTTPDPAIEILRINANSYILRQDKCSHFEAPFMYLLIGSRKALLFDTGAMPNPDEFPIYQTVVKLIGGLPSPKPSAIEELIVMHSHHHRDHYAGDEQFSGQANITLVNADRESLATQFGLPVSSTKQVEVDLGLRKIQLIPIPGHQRDSVALFDQQTGWLLTGDTFYPGSIRVKDWDEFKLSIDRLTVLTAQHQVSAILGGHVEMRSDKPEIYRIGSTFQPQELPLALQVTDLVELNTRLKKTSKSKTLRFEKFIISPLSFFERQLQKILSKKTKPSKPLEHDLFAKARLSLDLGRSPQHRGQISGTNKCANAFIGHQLQEQSVIHSPINYV